MTSERWRQIEQLFHAALSCKADRRTEFLASACAGDEELLQEVNSLLVARDEAQGFISENALQVIAREIAADNLESIAVDPKRHDARAIDVTETLTRTTIDESRAQERMSGKRAAPGNPITAPATSPSRVRRGRARIFKVVLGVFMVAVLGALAFSWRTFSNREARGTAPTLPTENQV